MPNGREIPGRSIQSRCGPGSMPGRAVLELLQVALDFPVRDLRAVLVPFGALGVDEVAEDVVAQGLPDHVVPLELVEGLAERARQLLDGLGSDRRGVHLEEGLLDRLGELEAL